MLKNRVEFALDYTPKCNRLLDIGCDWGDFTHNYLKKAKQVYAIDTNAQTIKEGKKRYKKISFKTAPAEKIPFPDSYFDVVTITDSFEHVNDEEKTMDDIYRVLKPGGHLVFSVPYKGLFRFIDSFNMKFYFPRAYKFWKGKSFNKKIYQDAPWHRHYSLDELNGFFKGKFTIEKKHRGGLFVYPVLWIVSDAFYWKLFKKTPGWIIKIHDTISNLDYQIPYGPLGFHIILRAKSLKKARK